MAAAIDTKVDSSFIGRSIAGYGVLHALKGVAWGNCVALSQALGKKSSKLQAPHLLSSR